MSNSITPPVLAQAGAGLPFIEAFFTRWFFFPVACLFISPSYSAQVLTQVGRKILEIQSTLSDGAVEEQVLIPKLMGIEDSSRNWSVLMTIEHLLITGQSMLGIAKSLSETGFFSEPVKIENVKPHSGLNREVVLKAYQQLIESYSEQIQNLEMFNLSAARHPHPWFWNMTARQWLTLNAVHHLIHLNQIKAIILRLPLNSSI